MGTESLRRTRHFWLAIPALAALALAPAVLAQPGFAKAFLPSTIGVGGTAVLRFDIDNLASPTPVAELAFSDSLPAGVVIAMPARAETDCADALLSAPAGGGTITLSGGKVGAGSQCSVSVDVTSSVAGTHDNLSGALTSSAGSSGTAAAALTVDPERPGIHKSFFPASIPLGGTSTLTLTIDNTASKSDVFVLSLTDELPAGMTVAAPSNAATDCVLDTFTALSGTSVIVLSASGLGEPALTAGSACTISVDVTTSTPGTFVNRTDDLVTGDDPPVSSGFATATLAVPVQFLVKSFLDDPVPPGGSVTLRFTLTNLDRTFAATGIGFDDVLDPLDGLSGIIPDEALPKAACGGTLAFSAGVLSFTGGSLPAGGTCSVDVVLAVPADAEMGDYLNTTSAVSATLDGSPVELAPATDLLRVAAVPAFSKEFLDDPVGAGDTVTLRFTLTNSSPDDYLTAIAFSDDLAAALGGLTATSLLVDTCNGVPAGLPASVFTYEDGFLEAGAGCTIELLLSVPAGVAGGVYPNTTSDLTAVIDTCGDGCYAPLAAAGASDDLVVVGAPRLRKEFIDDPAQPGGTVTLRFTIEHDAFAAGEASGITFTDDLAMTLTGLTANGLPLTGLCPHGDGSLTGAAMDTALTFSGATLMPGESCTVDVTLHVPPGAAAGSHPDTTSNLLASVLDEPVVGPSASDDLLVAGLVLTKEFVGDPVVPGDTVILRFTIDNIHPTADATEITFEDLLDPFVLDGLSASLPPSPDPPCGAASSLATFNAPEQTFPDPPFPAIDQGLRLTGGHLLAGGSCSFDITLSVPAETPSETYTNVTRGFQGRIGGGAPTSFPDAADALVVSSDQLFLSKAFLDDPATPGATLTLRLSMTNLDPSQAAADVAFTDDLDAALSGLVATGLPIAACGGTVSGSSLLTFSGGSLAAGATCSFDVTLQVPAMAPVGSYVNTTSTVTGTIGGLAVTGGPAGDAFRVQLVAFSKLFAAPAAPGGSATLTFTIHNLDSAHAVDDLKFNDDLEAVLSGLVAVGLPLADVCGPGSLLAGTSLLTLTGGTLLPGGSCTFAIAVVVPAGAVPGSYANTTSVLSQLGIVLADPAVADLQVIAAPVAAEIPALGPGALAGLGTLLALAALFALRRRRA